MIDEYYTWIFYGYHSDELSNGSHKPIVAVCDECGIYRMLHYKSYRDLCLPCKRKIDPSHLNCNHTEVTKQKIRNKRTGTHLSDKTKDKLRFAHKGLQAGSKHPMFGKHPSKETLLKQSKSMQGKNTGENHPMFGKHLRKETKDKLSTINSGINHPQFGKYHSEITRRKQSATQQGIPLSEWEGFITENPYCYKFNESLKIQIRNQYNNCDYMSGIHKDICNKGQSLDVHHVDYNKQQGCKDNQWRLIPLSKSNHAKTNSNRSFWNRLFIYSLKIDRWYYGDE